MEYLDSSHRRAPIIRIGHGPMAVEALLLQDIRSLVRTASQNLRSLALPIRIIVPSKSMRHHLGATLVRHLGGSLAGITIQTLHGLAREIIDRAGEPYGGGRYGFELLVRRSAGEQAVLREGLDQFVDGYAAVAATVMDFMDSGFEPAHADALEEQLVSLPADFNSSPLGERSRALVRVAARTCEAMAAHGIGVPSGAFRMASSLLARDPERLIPARELLIHGFADATGLATDLLEALLRHCGAWIYWDQPRDPAQPEQPDLGVQFTRRFFDRLKGSARAEADAGPPQPVPHIRMFRAPGAHAESRAVALRIATLMEQGASPLRIGVVARDLTPYRVPIRLHFRRLGIPFSGVGSVGPSTAVGRRIRGLLEMLRRRVHATADQWLELLAREERADIRLALHALGAGRISDAASLNPEAVLDGRDDYPLPVRCGLRGEEDDLPDGRGVQAPRRRLPGPALRRAVELARALTRRWAKWPTPRGIRHHNESLQSLITQELLWTSEVPGAPELFRNLEELELELPESLPLSYEEFVLLLSHSLREAGAPTLGGAGGGVQVLSVMEARGHTFEHLFVMGLNRDVFPRAVREDPLLPDPVRRALAGLLPDFPIKGSGYDEERYLFAQFLSSSPNITLSWQTVDDDARALSPSPMVERLRLANGRNQPEVIAPLYARPRSQGTDPEADGILPACEQAAMAGLYGSRAHFSRILPVAVAEARTGLALEEDPWLRPEALARARVAVLDEMDPDRRTSEGRARGVTLGPYFGFVGSVVSAGDPRRGDLYISTLEAMAACPWQVFLKRLLRIEPMPDPLEALPGVDALLLGNLVHSVLERLVRRVTPGMPATLKDAVAGPGLSVPWPDEEVLARILASEAARAVREAGMGLEGLARVLEMQARPYLLAARELDWTHVPTDPHVLAVEVKGVLSIEGQDGLTRLIHFLADRVDRLVASLRFTDYKTGKPISDKVKEATRQGHFLKAVSKGERLQAVAYILGAGGEPAEGRYVFLKPGIPETRRVFSVNGEKDFVQAFREATRALLAALDQGAFFPRLVEPDGRKEPRQCEYCEVSQACVRGDTGARMRILSWTQRAKEAVSKAQTLAPHEEAFLRAWGLRDKGFERAEATGEAEEQ